MQDIYRKQKVNPMICTCGGSAGGRYDKIYSSIFLRNIAWGLREYGRERGPNNTIRGRKYLL